MQSAFLTLALHPLPVSWQLQFHLSKLYFAMDFYRVASYIHVSSKSSSSYVNVLYVAIVTQIKKVKKEMMVMGSHLACINKTLLVKTQHYGLNNANLITSVCFHSVLK